MPRSPSVLAHRTFLLLSDPLKLPAGLRCHLHSSFWGYCGSRTNRSWYGTNQYGAFLRICNTTPKIRLRLPHTGNEEVLQDGYRLVLLPKLAYYAMWDGHGESFAVPRATPKLRSRSQLAATPPHPMWALTPQAILQP